jgi:hypothetical protein
VPPEHCPGECVGPAGVLPDRRKEPDEVVVADMLALIHQQRRARGHGNMVRLSYGEAELSSRTI